LSMLLREMHSVIKTIRMVKSFSIMRKGFTIYLAIKKRDARPCTGHDEL
jgi:hypothetical protein